MIVERDGLKWSVPDGSDYYLAAGDHEQHLLPIFEAQWASMPEGHAFLDIGSHVGRYTVRAAARGHHVVAVEPNLDSVTALRVNLALNGLMDLVEFLPIAAWSKEEALSLAPREELHRSPASWSVL